jgi:hypothetical protein
MATHIYIPESWLQVMALAAAIVIAALIIARAIKQQTQVMNRIAGDKAFDIAMRRSLDEETWRECVEQIAADVLHQPVRVTAFTTLKVERATQIRFALSDGRILEFTTAPQLFPFRQTLDPRHSPQRCAEIHALCRCFAQPDQHGVVPRDVRWHVRVLRAKPARMPHTATTPLQRQAKRTGET